jgi:hypothetical protein
MLRKTFNGKPNQILYIKGKSVGLTQRQISWSNSEANPYAYVYSFFTLALSGKSVGLTHEKKRAIKTIGV